VTLSHADEAQGGFKCSPVWLLVCIGEMPPRRAASTETASGIVGRLFRSHVRAETVDPSLLRSTM
jgi:hypothetical protein